MNTLQTQAHANPKHKIGLVLSGGGAKGAYQAGVMRAIQELNIPIDMIAGASIGALNGAVLASASNIDIGIDNLQELWRILPTIEPIKLDPKISNTGIFVKLQTPALNRLIYITLMVSAGLRLTSPVGLVGSLVGQKLLSGAQLDSVFSDSALQEMMAKYLNLAQLQTSLPLYVSVFEQHPNKRALGDFVSAIGQGIKTGIGIDNAHSAFKHIQSLPLEAQKEMLLASSALPMLFKAYQDSSGNRFTDGGQGGLIKSQGNTPIAPLIEAGCGHIIVTHLSEGSLWHRHDFPGVQVIEIRPSLAMGGLTSLLDFSVETITKLTELGYKDAISSLTRVQQSLESVYNLRVSTHKLQASFADSSASQNLESAMNRLRGLE